MKMRDPDGCFSYYNEKMDYILTAREKFESKSYSIEVLLKYNFSTLGEIVSYMLHRYGRGDPLSDIFNYFNEDGWPDYKISEKFILEHHKGPGKSSASLGVDEYSSREVFCFLAFLACMDPSPERLNSYRVWFIVMLPCRLVDVLFKSFIPDYQCSASYKVSTRREWWMTPLLDALARPPEERPAAMAAHMGNWHRLMRPLGWKPKREETDILFCDFAFEVALAVCAYDIDDSSFCDHPHYPRDLVAHYRQHIRHTRDAWRAEGVGAGVALPPPMPPKRVDLAVSKRKNFARWVELACDGYEDAVLSVLETTGKPRKVRDFDALIIALDEAGHAIHADIKDDASLASQASDLADARGLGPFDAPDDPPQGPARCTATLLALEAWVTPRGYRLLDLDGDDDAWHAVLVQAVYAEEFLALGQALGLRLRLPQQVYLD